MMRELSNHKRAYVILILLLVVFVFSFLAAWPNRNLQRVYIGAMVVAYVVWGAVTHFKSDHLTREIMYEYVGVSGLAGFLLWLITL